MNRHRRLPHSSEVGLSTLWDGPDPGMTPAEQRYTGRSHAGARVVAWIGSLFMLAVLAACSSATSSVSTPPTTRSSAEAGNVATAYMQAVMAADFTKAATYVVKQQQNFIKALALSTGPGTLLKMSGAIAVGTVTVHGQDATAILVGQMCRTQAGGSAQPQCVENKDPNSTSPIFTIHLKQVANSWQVALLTPSASPS